MSKYIVMPLEDWENILETTRKETGSTELITSGELPDKIRAVGDSLRDIMARTVTEIQDDRLTSVGDFAFYKYDTLTSVKFPAVTSIGQGAFYGCSKLTSVDFSAITHIEGSGFNGAFVLCGSLTKVIIRSETMCTLDNAQTFTNCYHLLGAVNAIYNPNGLKDGYIYVPADLVDTYKADSVWSNFASQIKSLDELE